MPLNHLASGGLIADMGAAPQPFVGDAPIITDSGVAGATFAKWTIIAIDNENGSLVPYDKDKHQPGQAVISAVGAEPGHRVPYYDSGKFNWEVVVKPTGLDTLGALKLHFHGTMLHFGHLI